MRTAAARSPWAPGAQDVSSALRRMLADRFGCEVADAEAPARLSGGYDFWVYGLHFAGPCLPERWAAPLVARIAPLPERLPLLQRESRVQAWVAAHGYPAPSVLEVLPPGELLEYPVQVMERRPGTSIWQAMRAAPRRMLALSGQLGTCHAALHRLPLPEWAGEWTVADEWLRLPRRLAVNGSAPGLAEALERIERILPQLADGAPALCHGDYGPGNVLLDHGALSVIDWTFAGIADRHGDIARTAWLLLSVATAAPYPHRPAMRALAPALSHAYLSAYRRELPVDAARLRLWTPVHILQNWAGVVTYEEEPPSRFGVDLAAKLRSRFWRRLNELT